MKQQYIALLCLVLANGIWAQNTVKMTAVKGNDYGVAYSLPKTAIKISAEATKTTLQVGKFYQYANIYLNISNPIEQDQQIYTLDKLDASTIGIPDRNTSYLVEFKSNTVAPYVTLTQDGLICAINADVDYSQNSTAQPTADDITSQLPNPESFLTAEILRAGTLAKQAELTARLILQLRETKTNIISGEADNMPPDGEAYKVVIDNIDKQEKALTSMFAGTITTQKIYKDYVIDVSDQNIENLIVFRFSKKLGFVANDNLAGVPVYLSLTNKNPKLEPVVLSPKEQKDMEKKFSRGIVYNIPAKANLKLSYDNRTLLDSQIDVVQFGTQEVLTPQMFDSNKTPIKVIFYPNLGAIKQIIQ